GRRVGPEQESERRGRDPQEDHAAQREHERQVEAALGGLAAVHGRPAYSTNTRRDPAPRDCPVQSRGIAPAIPLVATVTPRNDVRIFFSGKFYIFPINNPLTGYGFPVPIDRAAMSTPTWKAKLEGLMPEALAREIDVFETQMELRRQG